MSTSVDTKIVELRFDQADFSKKTEEVLLKLENLNRQLDNLDATGAFSKITQNARNVDISNISSAAEQTQKSFSALEIFAITAIANISNSLTNLGKSMVKNLISPITSGGLTRAKNIELASFQFEGLGIEHSQTDLDNQVSYYSEVMDAVLGTAYSYDVAAKAASQLAASNIGVTNSTKKLADGSTKVTKVMTGDMTKALMGIAGVASMTGSDFDSISQIFTRVAGQGRVMAIDLNSIAARGLNAAAVLGKSLGKTEAEIRDMVSKGKISFEDFSKAMSDAYGTHAKDSTKMFTGALADVEAALARIGADFYGPALTGARDVLNSFTPLVDVIHDKFQWLLDDSNNLVLRLSNTVSKGIDILSYGLKSIEKVTEDKNPLADWIKENSENYDNVIDAFVNSSDLINKSITTLSKGLNGIKIDGIKMLSDYLNRTSETVKKDIKSGTIGLKEFRLALEDLYFKSDVMQSTPGMWDAIEAFLSDMEKSASSTQEFTKNIDNVKRVLIDLDTLFGSVGRILRALGETFISIAASFTPLLDILAGLVEGFAEVTIGVLDFISRSTGLDSFLNNVAEAFANLGRGLAENGFTRTVIDKLTKAFQFLGDVIQTVYKGAMGLVNGALKIINDVIEKIMEVTSNVDILSEAIRNLGVVGAAAMIAKAINSILKPTEALANIAQFLNNFGKTLLDIFGSIKVLATNIGAVFGAITDAIKSMAASIKADIVIKVAIAIATLAGALYVLSLVDGKKGANSLKLLAEQLVQMMALIGSAAVLITALNKKSKGLFNINILSRKNDTLTSVGNYILKLSTSIFILAEACKKISEVPQDKFYDAVGAISFLLGELFVITKMLGGKSSFKFNWKSLEKETTSFMKGTNALLVMAGAVWVLADAATKIGNIPADRIEDAIGVISLLLAEITIVAKILGGEKTKGFVKAAVSLTIMCANLEILANVFKKFASMDQTSLERAGLAITTMLGMFTAMALVLGKDGGTKGFIGAAVSIFIIVEALKVMAEVFASLQEMDLNALWESFALCLLSLASIALILGGLGEQKGLLGASVAILLVVNALRVLGTVLQTIVDMGLKNAGLALVVVAGGLTVLGVACAAFNKVPMFGILKLAAALALIAVDAALFGAAAMVIGIGLSLVAAGVHALASTAPELEGFVTMFLVVIGMLILAASMLAPFTGAILLASVALAAFGASLISIGTGLQTISVAIDLLARLKDEMGATAESVLNFAKELTNLSAYTGTIKTAADGMKNAMNNLAKSVERATEAFKSAKDAGIKLVDYLSEGVTLSADKLIKAVNSICKKAAKSADNVTPFVEVGSNLTKGLIKGINSQLPALEEAVQELEAKAERALRAKAKIKSPSRVWAELGSYLILGMAKGILNSVSAVGDAVNELMDGTNSIVAKAAEKISRYLESETNFNPTITPVVNLDEVAARMEDLNTLMTAERAMAVSASMQGNRSTTQQISDAVNAALNNAVNSIVPEIQNGGDSNLTVEVPLYVNGKQFAKATASDIQNELDKASLHNNRALGLL